MTTFEIADYVNSDGFSVSSDAEGAVELRRRVFRVRPFDADVHVSLVLKLSPLFAAMVSVVPGVLAARQHHSEPGQVPDAVALMAEMAGAVGPVAERLAALDRQGDAKIVIDACLQAADQQAEGKWYPVMTRSGSISNRDNATYDAKLKITMAVVRINFGPMLKGMGLDLDMLMGEQPDAGV